MIQEIFTGKEIEVRSQTKNALDRKDISDICDICKGKSENQSKFVVKEVLEREFQKPKTAIQKKDEEMGLKEAEIRSLLLEIKKFENNKKTAASEITTLKTKIREITLQYSLGVSNQRVSCIASASSLIKLHDKNYMFRIKQTHVTRYTILLSWNVCYYRGTCAIILCGQCLIQITVKV